MEKLFGLEIKFYLKLEITLGAIKDFEVCQLDSWSVVSDFRYLFDKRHQLHHEISQISLIFSNKFSDSLLWLENNKIFTIFSLFSKFSKSYENDFCCNFNFSFKKKTENCYCFSHFYSCWIYVLVKLKLNFFWLTSTRD